MTDKDMNQLKINPGNKGQECDGHAYFPVLFWGPIIAFASLLNTKALNEHTIV